MKMLSGLLLGIFSVQLAAAEISVLCAGAARGSVLPLIETFVRENGHTLKFDYGTAGQIQAKLKEGARPDVVIVTTQIVADLEKAGTVAQGTVTPLARTGMGVGVAEGAPAPDISSVDALRKALLAARAVAYIDPKAGGTSGKHFAGVLDKLGIAAQVNPKAVLVPGGYAADRVAKGEADLVVHQISEILPVKGVKMAGPLPAELQLWTTYTAGLMAGAANADAARSLIKYLTGPTARKAFADRGMEAPN
jgi:molybdate transport system substrate-binding protein